MYEIRICVTLKCNYLCSYCSRDGEGIYSKNAELSQEELIDIVKNMTTIGVDSVRLTGGEPFFRPGLLDLAYELKKIEGIKKLSIVTNGSLITPEIIERLSKDNPFDYISVSLDTLIPSKYKAITKRDTFNIVRDNIIALSRIGIRTRINFVLIQDNVDELEDLVDFCLREKVDLKVLDLYNDTENYVNATVVEDILKEKGLIMSRVDRLPGDLGTPMKVYTGHDIEVIVKDSNKGTVYSSVACSKCPKYPCQLGVVGPIMSHDGIVKICNLGREMGINNFPASDLEGIKRSLDAASGISKEWTKVNMVSETIHT